MRRILRATKSFVRREKSFLRTEKCLRRSSKTFLPPARSVPHTTNVLIPWTETFFHPAKPCLRWENSCRRTDSSTSHERAKQCALLRWPSQPSAKMIRLDHAKTTTPRSVRSHPICPTPSSTRQSRLPATQNRLGKMIWRAARLSGT